jgi:hypothetical protein
MKRTAIPRNKTTKGWPVHPKKISHYRNDWTTSDFFEKTGESKRVAMISC